MNVRIFDWRLLLVRGIFAVIFGIAAFVWPEITVNILIILFGIYILVDAVIQLASALRDRPIFKRWWLSLLQGILGLALAFIFFIVPEVSATAIVLFIAAWALVTGVVELVLAAKNRNLYSPIWMVAVGGFLSIVLGVLLFLQPTASVYIILWILAVYALVYGITMIIYGIVARSK